MGVPLEVPFWFKSQTRSKQTVLRVPTSVLSKFKFVIPGHSGGCPVPQAMEAYHPRDGGGVHYGVDDHLTEDSRPNARKKR